MVDEDETEDVVSSVVKAKKKRFRNGCASYMNNLIRVSEKTRVKTSSRKKIKTFKLENAKIAGLPSGILRAAVSDWTLPAKLVNKMDPQKVKASHPPELLNLVRNGFQAVAKSDVVPKQLTRSASNCYDYSDTASFIRTFLDNWLRKVQSAATITESALKVVTSSTIEQINNKITSSLKDDNEAPSSESVESDSQVDDFEIFWRNMFPN
ncbi:hypothetical protein VTP01DRAFT_6429 [Rhizomucor pusillus]|uniref:uncharacterized protein n=1 Tax=Rhizomucor pusillus TaxID=4840 RepID=UPI003742017C